MAALEEKLAENVRKYPVLHDKSCPEFKENQMTELAWGDVAAATGLESGEEAKSFLETRELRDKKRLEQATEEN